MQDDAFCPRCRIALTTPPDDFSTREVAHRCARCHGQWIAGHHVGVVFPALAAHGKRLAELIELGAREGTECPSCRDAMLEFPFFDLWLDLCERCHGLWLDGDEAAFVEKSARDEDGLPERTNPGGYRANAQAEPRTRLVTCIECEKDVHPRRTILSGDGPICDSCVEIEAMSESLRASSGLKSLAREPGRLLKVLARMLDLKGKLLQRGAPK